MTLSDNSERRTILPSADALVSGYIQLADLVESGQYLKVLVQTDPPRIVTIWIDETVLLQDAARLVNGSGALYPEASESGRISNSLAVALFEALDSLGDGVTELEYRRGHFQEVED